MKSKFIIEIETKNMNDVRENADFSGEVITDKIERALHERFKEMMKEIEEQAEWFQSEMLDNSDISVETFESLEDYGDIIITVRELPEP